MAKKRSKVSTAGSLYGNYAEFLVDKFENAGITPGDLISIQNDETTVEGNLLSQNELGNDQTIIIKLDNGYNIGVAADLDTNISKLEGAVDLEKFQIYAPEQSPDLPTIDLIATGGTIASRIDYRTGGVVMAMEPEEIFASLPELFNEISFSKIKSLFSMGSEDMYSKQWSKMAKEAANSINDGVAGVVITHGTDIMAYSSAALSFMLPNVPTPVVFTGAQRSSDRGSYDGAINLIAASRVAAHADFSGVMICMHESTEDTYCQLSRGTKVRKMHTSRRDAFKTINEIPMARIDTEGKIERILSDLPERSKDGVDPKPDFEEKVTLIKIHPGITPELLEWYIDKGTRGVIIEGTGLGHVPTFPPEEENRSWIPAFERARDEDIFIGMTSQCLNGRVHPFVYRALRTGYQLGVTFLDDMLPETAFIKLGWVLGNHPDEVEKVMKTNLAGEITSLSQFKEYEL